MKKLIMIMTMMLGCQSTRAAIQDTETVKFDKQRTLYLSGVVSGNVIGMSNEILQLADPTLIEKKPIYILINSPGGSVYAGGVFISAMKAAQHRGYQIVCGVTFAAASMAFSILDQCDVRYALESSKLLFHSALISRVDNVNMFTALEIYNMLLKINAPLIKRLVQSMGMDEEVFAMAFYQEKLWDAAEFEEACKEGYIRVVTDYQGVDKLY